MDVVILAGGRGVRAMPLTLDRPKALLPLAGVPLIEHVMRLYAAQGFDRFVLAVGYRGDTIEDHLRDTDPIGDVRFSWAGDDAGTGRRLRAAAEMIDGPFLATYADGFADIDINHLLAHHRRAGRAVTLTAVALRSQFGTVQIDGDGAVTGFEEKPTLPGHWINGGFFALERRAVDAVLGESLEEDILPALAAAGELSAYRHEGFWRSVDTFKDLEELEAMVASGSARWAGLRSSASS